MSIDARTEKQANWIKEVAEEVKNQGRNRGQVELAVFAEGAAGQDLRGKPGKWERATNVQQRKLVRAFDSWSRTLSASMSGAIRSGATAGELATILDSQLPALESEMIQIGRQGMIDAESLVTGKRVLGPQISGTTNSLIQRNNLLVREGLIPGIRLRVLDEIATQNLAETGFNIKGIRGQLVNLRVRPAQYAGGFWTAIFEIQKGFGVAREITRRRQGLPPEPVRWVLDPQADHCATGADGFFGCPTQAGNYPSGWGSLVTVPAGMVSCRGNCRCIIEVFTGGRWRRGVETNETSEGEVNG